MRTDLRHRFIAGPGRRHCGGCGEARGNIIHKLGSRCSVCFRYFRHCQLDGSRRCDECAP